MKQITTTTKNIIDSGSVFTFKSELLRIKSTDKIEMEFNFLKDPDQKQKISTEIGEEGKYLKVLIYNAKGIGATTEPLLVGHSDDNKKNIYLSLSFQESTESYLCNYTIFEDKGEK